MKPLPLLLHTRASELVLNVAFRKSGYGHGWELFPRCVPIESNDIPSERSYISFCSQAGSIFRECIIPTGDTVGYEDATCIGGRLVICNKTVRRSDPITGRPTLWPIPSLFHVNDLGQATQVGELSDDLSRLYCKGLTPLSADFVLIRPIFDESNGVVKEDPRILLCKRDRFQKGSNLDLRPEMVFLKARPNEGIGISAPPVDTPYGKILVYHRIFWNEDHTQREYRHYPLLMDKEYPWVISAFSNTPMVTCIMFPISSKCWVSGATYFRNLVYDSARNSLQTIVTESDINNYWLEVSMSSIIRGMREYNMPDDRPAFLSKLDTWE